MRFMRLSALWALAISTAGSICSAQGPRGVLETIEGKILGPVPTNELVLGVGHNIDLWETGTDTYLSTMLIRRNFNWGTRVQSAPEFGVSYFFGSGTAYGLNAGYFMRVFFRKSNYTGPYVAPGFGVIYTNLEVEEIDRKFNFTPQIALGVKWRSQESVFTMEYRFHHVSNGGTRGRNLGLNSNLLLWGMSF